MVRKYKKTLIMFLYYENPVFYERSFLAISDILLPVAT